MQQEKGGRKPSPSRTLWQPATSFCQALSLSTTVACLIRGPIRRVPNHALTTSECRSVGLPSSIKSRVQTDFATPLPRDDYFPVHVHVDFDICYRKRGLSRMRKSLQSSTAGFGISHFAADFEPDWSMDVHLHAEILQNQLVHCLQPQQPRRDKAPMRTTMSSSTWALVQEKHQRRQQSAEANKTQRQGLLRTCFSAWVTRVPYEETQQQQLRQIHKDADILVATALHHFRALGRLVIGAMRRDDVQFYQNLLAECADFSSPSQAKQVVADLATQSSENEEPQESIVSSQESGA